MVSRKIHRAATSSRKKVNSRKTTKKKRNDDDEIYYRTKSKSALQKVKKSTKPRSKAFVKSHSMGHIPSSPLASPKRKRKAKKRDIGHKSFADLDADLTRPESHLVRNSNPDFYADLAEQAQSRGLTLTSAPSPAYTLQQAMESISVLKDLQQGIPVLKISSTGDTQKRYITLSQDKCTLFITHGPVSYTHLTLPTKA